MRSRAAHPTILLTGFAPFGGETVNASWLAVQALQGDLVLGHRIIAAQLPTVFDTGFRVLSVLLRRHRPTLVVCVGQAAGRAEITLERVAINLQDATIADNAGRQPRDQPIAVPGPTAYFSSLPLKTMAAALQGAGIATALSCSAGTFVCNDVFFRLMHALARQRPRARTRGGLVHVPRTAEQDAAGMPLPEIVRALRLAVQVGLSA